MRIRVRVWFEGSYPGKNICCVAGQDEKHYFAIPSQTDYYEGENSTFSSLTMLP